MIVNIYNLSRFDTLNLLSKTNFNLNLSFNMKVSVKTKNKQNQNRLTMLNVQRFKEKKKKSLPIWMEISPIAQVALLHTEMNSGFRLVPKMGMKSAKKNNIKKVFFFFF